jgi:DNA-binding XRE family transcriptional regulator
MERSSFDADRERWLPVPGWEGFYDVSDLGRVRSLDRVTGRQRPRRLAGCILKPQLANNGRFRVTLRRDGVKTDQMVHRLVMLAFVGPCPPGLEVLHGVGRELDNRLVNLKYGTHSENTLDKYRDGTDNAGENCYCAVLTWEQVREIRRLRAEQHLLQRELAARFNVSDTTIRKILRGETWREDRRAS